MSNRGEVWHAFLWYIINVRIDLWGYEFYNITEHVEYIITFRCKEKSEMTKVEHINSETALVL